jgi:hypothetical protein
MFSSEYQTVGNALLTKGKHASAFLGKKYTDRFGNCDHPGHDHFGKEFNPSHGQMEHTVILG